MIARPHFSGANMLPTVSMHAFRFSIILLLSGAVATARQNEQETATSNKPTSTKASTKSTSGGKSTSGKSKTSKEDNGLQPDEAATTQGIEMFAPRKMEMQFGMRFFSNDNYCTNMHATIPFPLNWPEQKVTDRQNHNRGRKPWPFGRRRDFQRRRRSWRG